MASSDDRSSPYRVTRLPESRALSSWTETADFAGSRRQRYKRNRAAKSKINEQLKEDRSKRALVLGGGAPNMALMAGTVLAFAERGVEFDVVSTAGAGAVIALLWLAPKDVAPSDALRNVVNLSVSDFIYRAFPVNYKVFSKPGSLATFYRQWLSTLPGARIIFDELHQMSAQRLFSDWIQLVWGCLCPTDLSWFSQGLCAPLPFIDGIIDFSRVSSIRPYFYVNAYNIDTEDMDDFRKEDITSDHLRAALAFPFIYGPFTLGKYRYYEGAVVDCLNYKDLVEKHAGLETIVVLDVLGAPSLIRAPRDLYDSWVLSMIIPLVATAQDDTEIFALKYNNGYERSRGAKRDLLKVYYDIPDADLDEVLDWSISNAQRLFAVGYDAGMTFCDQHAEALGLVKTRSRRAASRRERQPHGARATAH